MSPHINGVYETCLYVTDLAAAVRFYTDVLGLRRCASMGTRGQVLRVDANQVVILFNPDETRVPGGTVPIHGSAGSGHIAFRIALDALDQWRDRLRANGVAIETEIEWSPDARSIYFRDPSANSVELAAGEIWPA